MQYSEIYHCPISSFNLAHFFLKASDIIALQLLLQYWTDNFPGWAISLIFLVVVIALNLMSVRVYGEVC